jgi:hypothetical protein
MQPITEARNHHRATKSKLGAPTHEAPNLLMSMIKYNLLRFEIPHVVDTHRGGKKNIGDVRHHDIVRVHHCFSYGNHTFGIYTYGSQWNHPSWVGVELPALADIEKNVGETNTQFFSSYGNMPIEATVGIHIQIKTPK